jgi:chorismate synthase
MLRYLTAGESHGKGQVVILEGMPAGVPVSEEYITRQLKRRQGGYGRGERMKIEKDRAEIISGVRHGLTLGSPISMLIHNKDWENWKDVMSVSPVKGKTEAVTRVRPGHADLAGVMKYGHDDVRNVLERASARETAARVAAAAVVRGLLDKFNIVINSHTVCIGGKWAKAADTIDWDAVEASPVYCTDPDADKEMTKEIDAARDAGDTVGGIFEVVAEGVPVGLGSYVHPDRKLDGKIAQAMMCINAVKGVSFGMGFDMAALRGSKVHDVIGTDLRRKTNNAGGIEGGMSNGEPIKVWAVVKPIPTLGKPLPSIDLKDGKVADAHYERSDVCVVPAAGVVGEAMLALVLAEAMMEKFGGDNISETLNNYKNYVASMEAK